MEEKNKMLILDVAGMLVLFGLCVFLIFYGSRLIVAVRLVEGFICLVGGIVMFGFAYIYGVLTDIKRVLLFHRKLIGG